MISGIITAILLAVFLGGTAWAYSGRRRAEFEAAARMPLEDLPSPADTANDAATAEEAAAAAAAAAAAERRP